MSCPCSAKSNHQPAKPSVTDSSSAMNQQDPNFLSKGQVNVTNSGNYFVDLAYSIPFVASAADSYITSILSKQIMIGVKPTFFQIPYIFSASDALINGKYTSSIVTKDNLIITTYAIPYDGEFKEQIATIITYFNKDTNILFYEIPREFSYNSVEQASVALTQGSGGSFSGKISIPNSFVSNIYPENTDFFFDFTIVQNNKNNDTIITSIDTADVIAIPTLRRF